MGSAGAKGRPGLEPVCPQTLDRRPGGWVPPSHTRGSQGGDEGRWGAPRGQELGGGTTATGGDRQRVQGCGQSRAWALNLWADSLVPKQTGEPAVGIRGVGPPPLPPSSPGGGSGRRGWPWAKAGSTFVTRQCLSSRSHPVPRWQGCKLSPGCQAGGTHRSASVPPPHPCSWLPSVWWLPGTSPGKEGCAPRAQQVRIRA